MIHQSQLHGKVYSFPSPHSASLVTSSPRAKARLDQRPARTCRPRCGTSGQAGQHRDRQFGMPESACVNELKRSRSPWSRSCPRWPCHGAGLPLPKSLALPKSLPRRSTRPPRTPNATPSQPRTAGSRLASLISRTLLGAGMQKSDRDQGDGAGGTARPPDRQGGPPADAEVRWTAGPE